MLTDYALAGVTGWLAWSLFRSREGQRSRSLWALAFAALALGAALGGTWHGFAPLFAETAVLLLWKATVFSVGIASFGMLSGSAVATTAGGIRSALVAVAAAKLAIYLGWMLGHSAYIYVILDTGSALAAIAVLHLWSAARARDPASRWMLGAAGVSVSAAAVQASGFALHRHFNHNDLYHVIQVAAMFLFWAGVKRLRDRDPSAAPAREGRTP